MPQLVWTQHWTAADQPADLGFRITREPTGYVVRAGRHGKDKDWPVIETCRSLDGARRTGVFRLVLLPAQSSLLTGHDLMPKYAMVRFCGKEMRFRVPAKLHCPC
jgi:hypothetical protein